MTPARRRSTFLLGLALLVALLVGGRWLALETAERAWGESIGRGDVYVAARDLARLVRGIVLLVAIGWGTANLYCVYRSIGSVQLPRRLGDLEIVEAVPQRVLLVSTLASGIAYGLLLTIGTGEWWLRGLLASKPPHFGITDPVLHRDLGFYVAALPWAVTCKDFALLATTTAVILVALLYLGIGSLRFSGWRPVASAHARAHLGVLLALLALTLVRGALLDPAEAVAGLHGSVDRAALGARIPGARVVAALGLVTVFVSLVWSLRERPRMLVAAWGALLFASLAAYVAVPALQRSAVAGAEESRDGLERLAFGVDWRDEPLHGFPTVTAAVTALPVWDPDRAAAVARRTPLWRPRAPLAGAAVALPVLPQRSAEGRAGWLIAPGPDVSASGADGSGPVPPGPAGPSGPGPDWTLLHRGALARAGQPLAATEADSGLVLERVPTRDSVSWFGPGFREFAVAAPDTWPVVREGGVPLVGWWRRTALAWTLQSPELARAQTDGLALLWRRDVTDRLNRLAPFASFADATPVVADSVLWWIAYGYLESDLFPLVRTLDFPGDDHTVRYLRVGFVGTVNAASGDTRLYLAPGADSLAGAWARLFAPLVRPRDSLPAALRIQLPFPRDAFRLAARQLVRARGDSVPWRPRPREPYELVAPPPPPGDSDGRPRRWMAQAFDTGSPAQLAGLLAGTMTPAGPRLHLWTPTAPVRLPTELLGSPETAPGVMRLWIADGALLTEQGLFAEPATNGAPKGLRGVYLTWGERASDGPTPAAALRNLLAPGSRAASTDTSLAGRWQVARRLAAEADSALAAGDLEAFGRLYGNLKQLLGMRRTLAPGRELR